MKKIIAVATKTPRKEICHKYGKNNNPLEMPGIEPGAFHMQSERATTALHPLSEYC